MSIFRNHFPIMGASGQSTGYEIDQSIRFNEANSPYMQKTYSGNGSRTTWSFSFWTKLGKSPPYNSTRGNFLIAYNTTSGAQEDIRIEGTNQQLQWFTHNDGATDVLSDLKTTQYLRDHSAWYHILCVADRTNAVSNQRQRIYINGERVTAFATQTYPSQNGEGHVGKSADVHYIGSRGGNSNTRLDGYMAEIHYIDGYAYGPEFFGEFKEDTDIWIPKEYTGSYGTNGFKIDGRDSSDFGDDESGNGNDYSTSGLVATDQRTDSPTNNHATWNALLNRYPSYANGNVEATMTTSNKWAKTVMNMTLPNTGTWYWEGTEFNPENDPATALGIVDSDVEVLIDNSVSNRFSTPMSTFTGIVVYSGPGQSLATYTFKNGSQISTSATPIISTSRLGFLWEPENNRFTIYDDGSQYIQFTSINAGNYVFGAQQATGGVTLNYRIFVEANDWTQTPSGITSANALNTKNIGS